MTKHTCSFTGHRPQSLPFRFNESDERCKNLKARLREEIIRQITENSVTHFICGMALGIDTYAAEIVIDLKAEYPNITLEAAIPCEGQYSKWKYADRERYFSILQGCDKKTLISKHYTSSCMAMRNRYMVENSDSIIAVWNGMPSGTAQTVSYARSRGIDVTVIYI